MNFSEFPDGGLLPGCFGPSDWVYFNVLHKVSEWLGKDRKYTIMWDLILALKTHFPSNLCVPVKAVLAALQSALVILCGIQQVGQTQGYGDKATLQLSWWPLFIKAFAFCFLISCLFLLAWFAEDTPAPRQAAPAVCLGFGGNKNLQKVQERCWCLF